MSEHIEVSTVICHIWSDIVYLCIETLKLYCWQYIPWIAVRFECHPYLWLFARNCSSGEALRKCITLFPNLSAIYVVQFAWVLPCWTQFRENPLHTHRICEVQTELQSAVTMDQVRLLCSAATTVTVVTQTCRLFFLSATEELLERVLTLRHIVAMLLASQSLEYIVLTF